MTTLRRKIFQVLTNSNSLYLDDHECYYSIGVTLDGEVVPYDCNNPELEHIQVNFPMEEVDLENYDHESFDNEFFYELIERMEENVDNYKTSLIKYFSCSSNERSISKILFFNEKERIVKEFSTKLGSLKKTFLLYENVEPEIIAAKCRIIYDNAKYELEMICRVIDIPCDLSMIKDKYDHFIDWLRSNSFFI